MDASARPETPSNTDDKSSPVHGSRWDLLKLSPILARALQYLDDAPGSGDSCESLDSALTEDLSSSRDETRGASERIPI